MSANQYELLKCEDCGKTLGYIYASAKLGFAGLLATPYWFPHGPPRPEIEKTAFCETCFQKRLDEISQGKPEPKAERDKSVESRAKSKDRSLIR